MTRGALLIIWLVASGCGPRTSPTVGAVVVSCDRGEAADVAGLRPGDVVVEWRQGRADGTVESPFHLAIVEQELAPHGPVTLVIRRGRTQRRIVVPIGRWRSHLRPVLSPDLVAGHLEARQAVGNGEPAAAADRWTGLANQMRRHGRPIVEAWFRIQAAVALAEAERRAECVAEMAAGAEAVEDARLRAAYWERAGDTLLAAGRRSMAGGAFQAAIDLLEIDVPTSPALAFALLQVCRTDYRVCGSFAQRAAKIYGTVGEITIEHGQALNSQAAAAFVRSDLDRAEAGYREAIDVIRKVAPGSPAECEVLGNLGLVALRRGDFRTAQRIFREEIELAESLGTDTPQYSYAANYLGLLAKNLGRYEEARLYYERALTAFRQTRPGGFEEAGVLTNLGNVALLEGNLDAALGYHQQALNLKQQLDPGSADVASSLHSLGLVARWRGEYGTARRSLEQALELKEELSPGTPWTATTLFELGELARAEGSVDEAEHYHRRALEIWRRTRSRRAEHAMGLFALGAIERWRDRAESAERLWREAVDIIEERRSGMGMTGEDRTRFGSRYHGYSVELARLLAEAGRGIEAWDILERARTGALRAVLSHRDAAPAGVAPDLWFAANRLEREIDRLEARLARIDPSGDAPFDRLCDRLAAAEVELAAVSDGISREAPRYAAITTPRPVTFERFREVFDPGNVVLSYAVGEQQGMVLLAAADSAGELGVRVYPIPAGAEDLARRVNIFHGLIARGRSVTELEPALITQGRRLFELLMEPALDEILAAKRVLIIPDGPLVDMPFAAFVLPGAADRFLGHVKPLFFDASAGVYAELSRRRGPQSDRPPSIAAFGDPDYPRDVEVVRDHDLSPLPGSRTEVESVARLFGRAATTFLGTEATERAFRAEGRRAAILHCALHSVADTRFPMDSALFFSIPRESAPPDDDGVLTAWEIVDTFDTDADVVVLSACSTARGQTVPGEGIVGLARAFQVAGASTLVVSQWGVPDRSTAQLMERFYVSLKGGASTAESLRVAQLEVSKSDPGLAHPFHWASFQVRGDWR